MAYWSFVDDVVKSNRASWVSCTPSGGMLMPNQSVRVILTANVKPKHVDLAKETEEHTVKLEEILILRVRHGGDFFCVVEGTVDTIELSGKVAADTVQFSSDSYES